MTNSKPTLVVLAAGMGSRYGGLKQIDPVGPCGETLLDYSIFDAVRAGFGKVVFVIRRDIQEAFVTSVGAKYEDREGLAVAYAFQQLEDLPAGLTSPPSREKPWGTGHATLAAKELIDGAFAVINADDFYGARAFEILATHLADESASTGDTDEYAMVGFVLRETLSDFGPVVRGVCRQKDGFLVTLDELREITRAGDGAVHRDEAGQPHELSGDETASMNFWGFTPSMFGHLEKGLKEFLERHLDDDKAEFLLPDLVDRLISSGSARVKVLPGGGPWFGITYRDDRQPVVGSIRELVDAGVYPERLWN